MSAQQHQVLDLRRIGCSDLPAILGRDPYREPVDLWTRIVHGVDVAPSAWLEEAGDWGKRLEQAIARGWLERRGDGDLSLYRPPSINPAARAWQRYSLDYVTGVIDLRGTSPTMDSGLIQEAGTVDILEVKVRSSMSLAAAGWGADGTSDVDERVLIQVQGQMEAVRADRDSWLGTDVPDVEHVDVLVLVDGQALRHYPVPYDAEIAAAVREEAERFWRDHVVTETPPPLLYGEGTLRELRRRHPRLGDEIRAPDGADAIARDLAAAREQRKALEETESRLHARLAELAGGAQRMRADDWTWSQSDQEGSLRWGALLDALRERAGLSAAEFEAIKDQHRGAPKRVPRLTMKGQR